MLQVGQQSQLHVSDCDSGSSIPQESLETAAIVHLQEPAAVSQAALLMQQSGWVQLKSALDSLAFAAWVESSEGLPAYDNPATQALRLGTEGRRILREVLDGPCATEPVTLPDSNGVSLELSAVRHRLPHASVAGFDLYVLCPCGQELARDRAVTAALLRVLMQPEAPAEVEALTPQQRLIYRLLSNQQTYKEIASQLGVAHATIRVQIADMRKRLGPDRIPILRQA